MYICTSNESGEDVYFDKLTIVHNGGNALLSIRFDDGGD